jgi:hypothetical protein
MSNHASLPDAPTPIETLLLDLATQEATGSLTITDPHSDVATVWLRDGRLYTVSVPGRRALLGVRLVSSGVLTSQALGEALEVQRTQLQGWRLGELLVHLGYVEPSAIDAFIGEQLHDMLDSIIDWTVTTSRFSNGDRTRHDIESQDLVQLLKQIRERRKRWAAVLGFIGSEDAVPRLVADAADRAKSLNHQQWAVLCKIDGHNSVVDLADECGFTTLEAAELLTTLVRSDLATMPAAQTPRGVPTLIDLAAVPEVLADPVVEPAIEPTVESIVEPVVEPITVVEPVAIIEPVEVLDLVEIVEPVEIIAPVEIVEPVTQVAAAPTVVHIPVEEPVVNMVEIIPPAVSTVVEVPTTHQSPQTVPASDEEIHETRFELASLLTVMNREAGTSDQPEAAPVEEVPAEPAQTSPATASLKASAPTEFFSRSIDSASLMRELSSLSRETQEATPAAETTAPAQPVAPRTAAPVEDPKKKRGLFTR